MVVAFGKLLCGAREGAGTRTHWSAEGLLSSDGTVALTITLRHPRIQIHDGEIGWWQLTWHFPLAVARQQHARSEEVHQEQVAELQAAAHVGVE